MSDSPASLPSREEELALHGRLVDGDPTASTDIAIAFIEPLIQWLVQRNRKIHNDLCVEAADRAWEALIKRPGSYDACAGISLFAYLCMSAQGDLRNLLRNENRHHAKRESWQGVEQSALAGKYLGREDDPSLRLRIEEERRSVADSPPEVREGLTAAEQKVFDLMLRGERKTAVFAEAYGISHLPKADQQKQIKRVKDMLNKRMERARDGHAQSS